MDKDTIQFLSTRFDEVRAGFGTIIEGLRRDVQAVGEGHGVIRHEIAELRKGWD